VYFKLERRNSKKGKKTLTNLRPIRPNSRPPPPANPSCRYPWFPLPAATFLSPLSHPAVSLSLLPSLSPRMQTRRCSPSPTELLCPASTRPPCPRPEPNSTRSHGSRSAPCPDVRRTDRAHGQARHARAKQQQE
jgi:hypothetical protein